VGSKHLQSTEHDLTADDMATPVPARSGSPGKLDTSKVIQKINSDLNGITMTVSSKALLHSESPSGIWYSCSWYVTPVQ